MVDYRDYVMWLGDEGLVDESRLLLCCLKYMSQDDVKEMLVANDLQVDLPWYGRRIGATITVSDNCIKER